MAAHAIGTVLVADGDPRAALDRAREPAAESWRSLHMPYEAARTAALIGLGLRRPRRPTGAERSSSTTPGTAFARLGAAARRRRPLAGERPATASDDDRLSDREREVLVHLAAGETNREIAAALVISQHTVRRHVEHIFAKLGVTSRAAATAYAYEHGLL